MNKRVKVFLVAILLLSTLIPLVYSFVHQIAPVVDAQAYDNIAMNILNGSGFRENLNVPLLFDTSIVRAGPGYEFFLAGIYAVFGHSYEAVWIIQAILHGLSALLLFLTARIVFRGYRGRDTIALLATALFGLHPDLIEISAMIMTETLYLFFTILIMYVFVLSYNKNRSLYYALLLGVLTGIGILTRPPLLLFAPIFLFMWITKRQMNRAILFIFACTLVLSPWIIRNYSVYHQFIPTTLIGEYNLWVGNISTADGGQISGGFNPLTTYTEKEGFLQLKERSRAEFFNIITTQPVRFIKLSLIRVVRYTSLIRPMGFWFYQTGLQQLIFVASSLVSIVVLFVSGACGAVLLFRRKESLIYYLLALAITAPIPLIPTVVASRYRFQIYPFLALFGAYCITRLIHGLSKEEKRVQLYVLGFFFIICLLDVILFWPVIQSHISIFL